MDYTGSVMFRRGVAGLHRFGGASFVAAYRGAEWLLHPILTLDLADSVLCHAQTSLAPVPLLFPLAHAGASLQYRVRAHGVDVLCCKGRAICDDWPYAGWPKAYREVSLEAVRITPDLAVHIDSDMHCDDPQHPLRAFGGHPRVVACSPVGLLHGEYADVVCPDCGRNMSFMASYEDGLFEDVEQYIWGEDLYAVQIVWLWCSSCLVFDAHAQAD